MKDQRSTTGKQRYPAFTGRIMVDTYRGTTRVRAWPRKRGPSKSKQVREQNQWFKAANALAKIADASQLTLAIEATRNIGLYPRDLIVRAMGVGIMDIVEADGRVITYRQRFWEDIMFQGAIIRPSSDVTPGLNAWLTLSWPPPLIDTPGLWNPAEPTRLTIGEHLEIVEVGCDIKQQSTGGPLLASRIRRNGSEDVAWRGSTSQGSVGGQISTGPIPVDEGDYFEVLYFATRAGDFLAGPLWFSLTVLQAQ